MRRPVSAGCDTLPMFDVLKAQRKGDRQCRRLAPSRGWKRDFQRTQAHNWFGPGDRWSFYCVLDEAGEIVLEQKLADDTGSDEANFWRLPRSRVALETGTHSPWVSRLLTELGHEVIVAHAQKAQLITKSRRKDDRHDARTLARLAESILSCWGRYSIAARKRRFI